MASYVGDVDPLQGRGEDVRLQVGGDRSGTGRSRRRWRRPRPAPCRSPSTASNRPLPEPPAAAYTTSMPLSYIDLAMALPLVGSLKPVKSGGWVMYFTSTVASGLTALRSGDVAGLELLDQVVLDAADEAELAGRRGARGGRADEEGALAARRTPSSARSARASVDPSSGVFTTESTIAYFWFGFAAAEALVASPQRKPTATMRSSPMKPFMRSGRSLPSCAVGADSSVAMPKSALALSSAAAAESLNDLSPRPVTSNSRPTFLPAPSAVAVGDGRHLPVPASHLPVGAPVVSAPAAVAGRRGRRCRGRLGSASRRGVAAAALVTAAGAGHQGQGRGERGSAHEVASKTHALPLQLWNV